MDLGTIVQELASSVVSNTTLQLIFFVSIGDFVLGSLKALSNHTFDFKWVDAWVGDHLFKAVMIAFGMVFGIIVPPIQVAGLDINIVAVTAEGAAITYIGKTIASMVGNLNFGGGDSAPASVTPTLPEIIEDVAPLSTPDPRI